MGAAIPVAIVGAGPYGLSVGAHLRGRRVPFRIFGSPMGPWRDMPGGLYLKSFAFATTISNPQGLTFDGWCRERALPDFEPCSTESFAAYGVWLQERLLPQVERKDVSRVERRDGGFRLTLEDGEAVDARQVVLAVGLRYFRRLPPPLAGLPAGLASHTAEHTSYESYRGRDVAVIGAGQSALEAATLLHEAGARPDLLVRGPGPVFHGRTLRARPLWARLRAPITVLGAGRVHWVLQHLPWLPHSLPTAARVRFTRGHLGPAGSWWLHDRFAGKVRVRPRCELLGARSAGDLVALRVREQGEERELCYHAVIAGTGYEVDLDRLEILDPALRAAVARIEGAPRLDRRFQSSVPGLYFVGVSAMFSFGPLLRFVCGTSFCAPVVARALARAAPSPPEGR